MSHWALALAWAWALALASGRAGYSGELALVEKDELVFEMQLRTLGKMGHGCGALKGLTGTTIMWHYGLWESW
jgi:hypothetical protein